MMFQDVMRLAVTNKTAAARELGVSRTTLARWIAPGGQHHDAYRQAVTATGLENALMAINSL